MVEKVLLVLGMESVGKTMLVGQLRNLCNGAPLNAADSVMNTTPTIGVEMDSLIAPAPWAGVPFEVREIGGVMLQLWPQYFGDCGLLLFVVDMSQATQLSASCVELHHALGSRELRHTPVLLFLNKIDLPCGVGRGEIDELFRLPELQHSATQPLAVVEGSAATGKGLDEVLTWVCANCHHLAAG